MMRMSLKLHCLEVYVIIVESKDTCLKIVGQKKKTRITDQTIGNNQENEMQEQRRNQMWSIYFDEMTLKMGRVKATEIHETLKGRVL